MSVKGAKRRKNLLVDHPAWAERLSDEWNWEKNDELGVKPDEVSAGSNKKVWWIGKDCGHEWEMPITARTGHGQRCPFCSGRRVLAGFNDLNTTLPELAAEWHSTKNGSLTPRMVTQFAHKRVWWLGKCGHEWEARVADRAGKGCGCPYCTGNRVLPGFNDLATANPELVAEWHPTKNGYLTPRMVTRSTNRKVWWLGKECGHEWEQSIAHRTGMGCGCPKCASSHGEKDSAEWARSVGFVVDEQWRHTDCRDVRPLPFELMLYVSVGTALMEVAAEEYDGEQHSNPDTYYNQKSLVSGRGYGYVVRHDTMKSDFCSSTGRLLIRVPYTVTGIDDIGSYLEGQLRANGWGWWFDSPARAS